MASVKIRTMTKGDLPAVLEVEQLSFTTPWSEEAFEMELGKNDLAQYIVLEVDGRVIGYAGVWLIVDEGHITNVAVHPDARGKGYSNRLVKGLIELCREYRIGRMTLEVRVTNKVAQALYEKHGFEGCGVRSGYYADTKEDALIMWKEV